MEGPQGEEKTDRLDEKVTVPRDKWASGREFILACLASAVGLGNVWRFPYLCYENGGGAFLLPYILFCFVVGLPMYLTEASLGQFSSQGTITVWNFCPLFKGVGIGIVIILAVLNIYYNVIIAWTVYYSIKSLTFPSLPWTTCDNDWNTEYCFDDLYNTTRRLGLTNESVRATEEFWIHNVHDLSDSVGDIDGLNWHLMGCLFLAWTAVYICVAKGTKSVGKVVYFTAIFPYVLLFILFVKSITLPGAWEGIKFYITPQFGKLFAIKPWRDAAIQICFSLGTSLGVIGTLASYNDFHNNIHRDAIFITLANSGTSIFAGFSVFSILGFMAQDSGRYVEDVVDGGLGLAFIAYPEALARMPGSQFWSLIFFLMLFTLGIDSQFISVEATVTAIVDWLPPKYRSRKNLICFVVCVISCLLSIVMVAKNGLYIFRLIDWYTCAFTLTIFGTITTLTVSYIYGLRRFFSEIAMMIGFEPGLYWKICIGAVTPFILAVISLSNFVYFTPVDYNGRVYSTPALLVGWFLALSSFVVFLIYLPYALIFQANGSLSERVKALTRPSEDWGPRLPKDRHAANYN